jgi:sigma-B regulation protein RsbU (phosphoserine phosphatase)
VDLTLIGMVDNKELRHPLIEGHHLIGRADDAALKLVQPSVSRRHAEIVVNGPIATVRDLGSHNGTMLNGAKVAVPTPIRAGDVIEVANITFRVEGPDGTGLSMFNESVTLIPSHELSWDDVRKGQNDKRDLQSLLFRVLAEAGDLLTIPRKPEEMFEPILDLVETALLEPERVFILLLEKGKEEPVTRASRVKGIRPTESLALSRTMMKQVLEEKKSFLTSDPMNDPGFGGMMSMVSQGIRSAIAVPLFDNEDVIGLVYADDSRAGKRFSRDQLSAFTLLANVIAVAITHARYHLLEEEKRLQDAQLRTASEILDNILPAVLPKCEGYDLFAKIVPCFAVGGDLYDGDLMEDGRYAFLIGDVVGKGLGAALLVSHILSWTRFMVDQQWEPKPLITKLNEQVFSCTDTVRFTTFFLGYLEPASGKVTYVNAGHNPPFLVRADGTVETLAPTGMPVGIIAESPYGIGEVTLEPGDLLTLYSDGIPETQRADDEEYGEDTFEKLLVAERGNDLAGMFEKLQVELKEFRGNAPIGDDVTLLALRRCSSPR